MRGVDATLSLCNLVQRELVTGVLCCKWLLAAHTCSNVPGCSPDSLTHAPALAPRSRNINQRTDHSPNQGHMPTVKGSTEGQNANSTLNFVHIHSHDWHVKSAAWCSHNTSGTAGYLYIVWLSRKTCRLLAVINHHSAAVLQRLAI